MEIKVYDINSAFPCKASGKVFTFQTSYSARYSAKQYMGYLVVNWCEKDFMQSFSLLHLPKATNTIGTFYYGFPIFFSSLPNTSVTKRMKRQLKCRDNVNYPPLQPQV